MTTRFHSLDGLRAIAASLVVIHHLGAATLASNLQEAGHTFAGNLIGGLTASGVELFFVLSAVVLAGPYVRRERPLNLWAYTFRRISRLLPPYFGAWLLAGLAIFLATEFPTWWTVGAALPVFSLRDWFSQIAIVYFGKNYNFAWWSLTVEVAFYILLPVFILVFSRLNESGRWAAFGFSLLLAILVAPSLGAYTLMHNLSLYAACFCAGLVLASGPVNPRTALALVVLGAGWVLVVSHFSQLNQHVGWGTLYFGLTALAMERQSIIYRMLSKYEFVWLGERSYSLFLVHFTVIGLVCHAASAVIDSKSLGYFLLTRSLSIVLSLVATVVLFHFFERPFARGLVTGEDVLPRRGLSPTPDPPQIRRA
ncbi:MAG: acyltransferase [Ramlibacter sp.]|nr:acyltransferase [Ramlibacter sp.]